MLNRLKVTRESCAEMIEVLRESGLNESSERLRYLQRLADEDPDEQPIAMESLQQLTAFLMDERELGQPEIGVSPNGVALAQWRIMGGGILAMEFPGSGLIRFAGTSGGTGDGRATHRVSGTLPKAKALRAVRPFFGLDPVD